jgi:autotransporter-associated beta strand protein
MFGLFVATASLCFLAGHVAQAGSATWNLDPVDNNWNNPANWTPSTVPNGPNDIATFGHSNITAISISAGAEVNAITFDPGASAFTITVPSTLILTVSGTGIINNSGIMQNFIVTSPIMGETLIKFTGNATAGDLATFTNEGSPFIGIAETNFFDDSTAGMATFVNEATHSNDVLADGHTQFFDRSSAGEGTFTNLGDGGETKFMGDSTAADGTFILNTGGVLWFLENSNAGNGNFTLDPGFLYFSDTASAANGTFTIKGGQLYFWSASTIGDATLIANGSVESAIFLLVAGTEGTGRIELFDTGTLITQRDLPGVAIGSLEGDGSVNLGRHNPLIIGSNDLSTTFSGTIFDNGLLEKVGKGTLTLSGANTYTGTTTVSEGTLLATNLTGSATGTGPVAVNAGTLGGNGIITGTVTIGTGNGPGAALAPAAETTKKLTLTIQRALTLKSDATYVYTFRAKGNKARTDLVIANAVTINRARIDLEGIIAGEVKLGTILTLISNTSANPISGTFSNLADGAIVSVGGTNFQANYQGGDGNDLTLIVVP